MRGKYSSIRFHMKEMHGDLHERTMWKTFWKYKLPIMEASEHGIQRRLNATGIELEVYMYCSEKMVTETFENYRSEIVKAKLPLELQ